MRTWGVSICVPHPLGGSTWSKELTMNFPCVHPLHTHFVCVKVGPEQWPTDKCLTISP